MVPNGWNSKPLAQLLEKIIDYRGQSVPKSSSGIPLITARNVREGYLDFSNQEYVDESKFEEWMTRGIPQKGDILFTTEAPLGKACRYPSEGMYAIGQRTVTLRTNKKLDPEFLLYTILSERGQLLIDLRSSGSTAKGIKSSELKKVKIAYPESLSEQRKIAKILSTWDKAITTTEQLIAASQQQKKALMQQLLTGKKRLLNPETGKVFEGVWEHGFLGNLCVFKGGSAFKERYQGQTDGDYPFIKVSDMNLPKNGKFIVQANNWLSADVAKEIKAKAFEKGAVVFAKVGAALLLNRRRILVQPTIIDNNMMAAIPNKKCHTEFLYQLMLMIDFAKLVQDGAVPSINQSDLNRFKITYPMLEEQQKIASVLTAADKEIELLETKLAHLKEEKKALMQQLLTGKRRVKVEQYMEIAS
ncbi:restriction endonuclease subunit S [Plesiomonas shigelloides]|uniref:restriction endonuclease subunit S n=1 Tax=Plesiomonas shigelloides TaxID=703 RepID=UPI00387EEC8F